VGGLNLLAFAIREYLFNETPRTLIYFTSWAGALKGNGAISAKRFNPQVYTTDRSDEAGHPTSFLLGCWRAVLVKAAGSVTTSGYADGNSTAPH